MTNNSSTAYEVDAGSRMERGLEHARNAGLAVLVGGVALYTELSAVEEISSKLEVAMIVSTVTAFASEIGRRILRR